MAAVKVSSGSLVPHLTPNPKPSKLYFFRYGSFISLSRSGRIADLQVCSFSTSPPPIQATGPLAGSLTFLPAVQKTQAEKELHHNQIASGPCLLQPFPVLGGIPSALLAGTLVISLDRLFQVSHILFSETFPRILCLSTPHGPFLSATPCFLSLRLQHLYLTGFCT